MLCMKKNIALAVVLVAVTWAAEPASGLSEYLARPSIFFPRDYPTNRAQQILSVVSSGKFKYLGGLTSYWEPKFSTTLVYEGEGKTLTAFLEALNRIDGVKVRLTFSGDLSKETGSALQAGSWWVIYSHTAPDTITVRVNLAAASLGRDNFELSLPKPAS
jgi:hypothetical protein